MQHKFTAHILQLRHAAQAHRPSYGSTRIIYGVERTKLRIPCFTSVVSYVHLLGATKLLRLIPFDLGAYFVKIRILYCMS